MIGILHLVLGVIVCAFKLVVSHLLGNVLVYLSATQVDEAKGCRLLLSSMLYTAPFIVIFPHSSILLLVMFGLHWWVESAKAKERPFVEKHYQLLQYGVLAVVLIGCFYFHVI